MKMNYVYDSNMLKTKKNLYVYITFQNSKMTSIENLGILKRP